jgi:hypothetical protein
MDSFFTKFNFALLAAVICFNATRSLGNETAGGGLYPAMGEDSEDYILLAQNSAAPIPLEPNKDTLPVQAPAAVHRTQASEDKEYFVNRRDHFRRMQNTGFGLLMGGIGCGAGGILLMVTGINQMDRNHGYDQYGNATRSDKGLGTFIVGYVALLVGTPALVTTGIILNRVGNHKKNRMQQDIDAWQKLGWNVGFNSMRLSYSF